MAEKKVYRFTTSMLNKFPSQYADERYASYMASAQEEDAHVDERLNDVQRRRAVEEKKTPGENIFFVGLVIGAILTIICLGKALVALVSVMWLHSKYGSNVMGPILLIVGYWVLLVVVTTLLGSLSAKKRRQKLVELEREGGAISEAHQQSVRQSEIELAAECTAFRNAFEATAVKKATELADNPAIASIAQQVTEKLALAIDAADRRSHIERIVVTYSYNVYTYGVGFSYDNFDAFDFEQHRLPNLSGPLEQAALARAVASAVQLELMMRYPEDPSGTVPMVNIEHTYDSTKYDHTITTITYTAPNGYYQAVGSWT